VTDPTLAPIRDPFLAPGEGWRRVSPRLATARRLLVVLPVGLLAVAGAVAAAATGQPSWGFVSLVVGGLVAGWLTWLIGRQVRAVGYCLRTDDLLVVSGVAFRRLVVVPFGRMQLVDVTRGPVDRRFGLASVQLHTAAATSDAKIPGLTPEDAAELRDRLAALGEQRSGGL
jgi:uncharacterized protein